MRRISITCAPLPALPMPHGYYCGAVHYAVTARPLSLNACHCDDCKRLSRGPFGLYLHISKDALEIRGGAGDRFIRIGGSRNAVPIERCAACGTRIWHLPEVATDLVILSAGSLDESGGAVPTSHSFTESAAADAVAAEDAIVVQGFETTRSELWARFSDIYPASERAKNEDARIHCRDCLDREQGRRDGALQGV